MRKASIGLFILLALAVVFWKPIEANVKTLLFISQEFPQIPVKPLSWFTPKPTTQLVEFGESQEIVADIAVPANGCPCPSLIFTMGVYTQEKDRALLRSAADSFARLGYIVLWPRSKILDKTEGLMEDPQVFVESFKYLEDRSEADKERISFFGFSVGSSIAMVAAEDPEIADSVHSLIWFGGYYSLYDYLTELATRKVVADGQEVLWEPHEGATSHAEKVMAPQGGSLELFKKEEVQLTEEQKQALERYSPDVNLASFKGQLFILHDKSDSYVPWVESLKLKEAVPDKVSAYHIADLFGHVQPKSGKLDWGVVKELWGVYNFAYKVFKNL